ncbi:hypothetical protein [Terracoccus sp. 273MFTsu3.1]|uniref:hypothetical protein n=1 Tax=Terracoccus sp. 273MFTsu3.1 TaxID=1172188 RepID=UPI00036A2DE0|nr:hypothetical protein [Terracoccus sp. 273MFTsu3.1]
MKALLFAMHHAQAMHFMREISPEQRREFIVLTGDASLHRAQGFRVNRALFLDDWFRGWKPQVAQDIHAMLYVMGVTDVWERLDTLRQNRAREAFDLGLTGESEWVCFHIPSIDPPVERYWSTARSRKFHGMLQADKGRAALNALPGLDDKKGSKNPVGGIVFKEILDIDSPDSTFAFYADWYIRRNIRTPEPYLKEIKRDNISAALDWFRPAPSSL